MEANLLKSFKSFTHMLEVLSTEDRCREYLEKLRWNNEPICPHCGECSTRHYKLKAKGVFKGLRRCRGCSKPFTVTVGTMFEGTHISLKKWFIAIFIFSSHKKGISSYQLARDLGITQKSAWFMLGRIRNAYTTKDSIKMDGEIQIDETYVGGKNKNRHNDKKVKESQGRSVKDKTPVLGLINNGKVTTEVVANTKAKTLRPIIEQMVEKGAIVITDEWKAYNSLNQDYQHEVVKHHASQYVNKNGFSTNSVENFWSLLKRGITGIYHQVSRKHLKRYCDEFAFRFNTRKITDSERFVMVLTNTRKRLTYKDLIAR